QAAVGAIGREHIQQEAPVAVGQATAVIAPGDRDVAERVDGRGGKQLKRIIIPRRQNAVGLWEAPRCSVVGGPCKDDARIRGSRRVRWVVGGDDVDVAWPCRVGQHPRLGGALRPKLRTWNAALGGLEVERDIALAWPERQGLLLEREAAVGG